MSSALLASPPAKGLSVVERTRDGATWRGWPMVEALLWVCIATGALNLAYAFEWTALVAVVYLFALLQLAQTGTWRTAFYPGLAVGLTVGALRLGFFWSIFSVGAAALWLVFAFWVGLFVALARLCLRFDWTRLGSRFAGPSWGWVPIPFIWCGLEYFRSELYYLRFSWLSPGFALGFEPSLAPLRFAGVYGTGFLLMAVACVAAWLWRTSWLRSLFVLLLGVGLLPLGGLLASHPRDTAPPKLLHVVGVQLELPTESEVLSRLTELVRRHPEAELLVLSEYTFQDPVPERVKTWCRQHQRYLLVGGKDPGPGNNFYNTAFVISPEGEIVFRQGKSVPIQFFKDGLPAPEQKLWDSPWGRLGVCVCYDLSYSRVTDRLIQLGAQALLVPTMDVSDWGAAQHRLHARVAPVRAAEYGTPIFRVASSGISQLVDDTGHILASAPFPGEGAPISGVMELRGGGRRPWDRWLAPFTTGLTALIAGFFLLDRIKVRRSISSACEQP